MGALAGSAVLVAAAIVGINSSRIDTSLARGGPRVERVIPTVTFADEFDGPAGSAVDPALWVNEVGGQWNNGRDAQYYTPGTRNAALTGRGTLMITARSETYSGWDATRRYTSARLMSKIDVQYGHVEARVRLTGLMGAFPAVWLFGSNYDAVGWPEAGELDVMETANRANWVSGGIHGPQTGEQKNYYWVGGKYQVPEPGWTADWHTYGMDWTTGSVAWSIDGVSYARVSRDTLGPHQVWAVDQPADLVLNIAVGGFAGTPPADFGATMEVDWIRVTG